MFDFAHTIGWLAQSADPASKAAGGMTFLLGVVVAGATLLMLVIALLARRWALHDRPGDSTRHNYRSRVDPWFEAGRRIRAGGDEQDGPP